MPEHVWPEGLRLLAHRLAEIGAHAVWFGGTDYALPYRSDIHFAENDPRLPLAERSVAYDAP